MSASFGRYLRRKREALRKQDPAFTVRKFASQVGVQPSYVSKVEREEVSPPSEATIVRFAVALRENPDVLLALAGKVSEDVRTVIVKRPELFVELIRQLKDAPDHAVLRIVREVRDGNW